MLLWRKECLQKTSACPSKSVSISKLGSIPDKISTMVWNASKSWQWYRNPSQVSEKVLTLSRKLLSLYFLSFWFHCDHFFVIHQINQDCLPCHSRPSHLNSKRKELLDKKRLVNMLQKTSLDFFQNAIQNSLYLQLNHVGNAKPF